MVLPRIHLGSSVIQLLLTLVCIALTAASICRGDELVFQDDFKSKLGEGWQWRREHPQAWRVTDRGLEVRIEPGNMWGPANNASNVLLRAAPESAPGEIEVSVIVEHRPTEQYEQVDLVWYFDDSHMVKIGEELVDGKLSIVMGREEKDRTRTLAIIPLTSFKVQLQLLVETNRIRGRFRPDGAGEWRVAGECDLPESGAAKISLQCYQGPEKAEHWARITDFRIRRLLK
jgi:regulation of enolase protein 1 (concanavalin A-like superfamily)